jgi:hypothetical protein
VIQFRATDDLANVTNPAVQITMWGVSTVSSSPAPDVTITEAASSPITISGSDGLGYGIEGQATSGAGIGLLTVAGQPTPLDLAGNFSAPITLQSGVNVIVITATDIQMPALSTTVTVEIDLQAQAGSPPTIQLSADQLRIGVRIVERGLET